MRGFKVVNCGYLNSGKGTFSRRLLNDIRAARSDEVRVSANGESTMDWMYFSKDREKYRELLSKIDVGHRYFYTNSARIHIMDTPGPIEYFGNTLSAIRSADHVNLVVDVTDQEDSHVFLFLKLALKFCPGKVTVLVNKMDQVGWDSSLFREFCKKIRKHLVEENQTRVHCVPISAQQGDNVYSRSINTPWYKGESAFQLWRKSLMQQRRRVGKSDAIVAVQNMQPFKNQWVLHGRLVQGRLSVDDVLLSLPERKKIPILKLYQYDREIKEVKENLGLTIVTDIEMDHQFLVQDPLDFQIANKITARVFNWGKVFQTGDHFTLKHFSKNFLAEIGEIHSHSQRFQHLNESVIEFKITPKFAYQRVDLNSQIGTFSLIDPILGRSFGLGVL